MKKYVYPSKILLFGEYGVTKNYSGLSIPYKNYKGYLNFNNYFNKKLSISESKSNKELKKFFSFLIKNSIVDLEFEKLKKDLDKGMYFHSNIPQRYGLGSSGALISSIYDKYSKTKYSSERNIKKLKEIFSKMESFFHGNSSGLDPLVCFLKKPIFFHSKNKIFYVNIPEKKNINKKNGIVFLLNSGIPSKTYTMNKVFSKKLKNNFFKKEIIEKFFFYNKKCIESLLKNNMNTFLVYIKNLSTWVFNNLKFMIPKNIFKIWKIGIINDSYYMKLCGSGGGGYFLVFSRNHECLNKELKNYVKEVILNFKNE